MDDKILSGTIVLGIEPKYLTTNLGLQSFLDATKAFWNLTSVNR